VRSFKIITLFLMLYLFVACAVTTSGSYSTSSNFIVKKPAPESLDKRERFVCEDRAGLLALLGYVVNQMQFLNNDIRQTLSNKKVRDLDCDAHTRVPLGTKFFHTGFYENDHGFIFSLFAYNDDGFYNNRKKPAQTADAIFESKYWEVVPIRSNYGNGKSRMVIQPKSCDVLLAYYPSSVEDGIANAPKYIFIPEKCNVYSN
jgi:hypothetical protein